MQEKEIPLMHNHAYNLSLIHKLRLCKETIPLVCNLNIYIPNETGKSDNIFDIAIKAIIQQNKI